MVEFSGGEELYPFSWVVGTENVKICFKFLIGLLSLTISLRMIGGRKENIILEETSEFFGEGRSKTRTTIGDESVM